MREREREREKEEKKEDERKRRDSVEKRLEGNRNHSHPPLFDWCVHKHNSAVIFKFWSFTSILLKRKTGSGSVTGEYVWTSAIVGNRTFSHHRVPQNPAEEVIETLDCNKNHRLQHVVDKDEGS